MRLFCAFDINRMRHGRSPCTAYKFWHLLWPVTRSKLYICFTEYQSVGTESMSTSPDKSRHTNIAVKTSIVLRTLNGIFLFGLHQGPIKRNLALQSHTSTVRKVRDMGSILQLAARESIKFPVLMQSTWIQIRAYASKVMVMKIFICRLRILNAPFLNLFWSYFSDHFDLGFVVLDASRCHAKTTERRSIDGNTRSKCLSITIPRSLYGDPKTADLMLLIYQACPRSLKVILRRLIGCW